MEKSEKVQKSWTKWSSTEQTTFEYEKSGELLKVAEVTVYVVLGI